MFHVGDEVVCVNVDPFPGMGRPKGLVKGNNYIIRGISKMYGLNEFGVHVQGITHGDRPDARMGERAFFAWRFRKVVRNQTSIEVFQTILNRVPGGPAPASPEKPKVKEKEKV